MSKSFPADDLATLLAFLSRKQVHAQRLLEPLFEGDRYKDLLASWRSFLQDPTTGDPEPEDAARSLIDVTSGHILRLHSRLFHQARAIHDETPAEAIHEVRIEANKLRYMIDATSSLYDRRDLDRIIDSLTRMQSVLGDFNDAQVQERNLLISGQALLEAGEGEPGVLLTVRRLAENARNRALSRRPKVERELSRFCRDDIRIDFRRFFNRDALVETSQ
jgi:CHAD domain-containing protein